MRYSNCEMRGVQWDAISGPHYKAWWRVTRLSWRLVLRCFTIMTPLLLWTAEGLRAKASLHHSWVANCCSTDSQSSIPEARDKLETAWFTSLTIKVISKPGTSSLYPITALILEATASRCSLSACHSVLYLLIVSFDSIINVCIIGFDCGWFECRSQIDISVCSNFDLQYLLQRQSTSGESSKAGLGSRE